MFDEKAYRDWLCQKDRELAEQKARAVQLWLTFIIAVLFFACLAWEVLR